MPTEATAAATASLQLASYTTHELACVCAVVSYTLACLCRCYMPTEATAAATASPLHGATAAATAS